MVPPLNVGGGGGKRLSLIQMILLTHLKAGFEKRGTAVVIVTAQIHKVVQLGELTVSINFDQVNGLLTPPNSHIRHIL